MSDFRSTPEWEGEESHIPHGLPQTKAGINSATDDQLLDLMACCDVEKDELHCAACFAYGTAMWREIERRRVSQS